MALPYVAPKIRDAPAVNIDVQGSSLTISIHAPGDEDKTVDLTAEEFMSVDIQEIIHGADPDPP